jgi:hypothetical protein
VSVRRRGLEHELHDRPVVAPIDATLSRRRRRRRRWHARTLADRAEVAREVVRCVVRDGGKVGAVDAAFLEALADEGRPR